MYVADHSINLKVSLNNNSNITKNIQISTGRNSYSYYYNYY